MLEAVAEEARTQARIEMARKQSPWGASAFTSDGGSGAPSGDEVAYPQTEAEAARHALEVAVNQQAAADGIGGFPVHIAARNGDSRSLEELLRHNANPQLLDAAMRTPVHVAASAGRLACLSLLLSHPGVSDVLLEATDHEGCTALHCAARSGNEACVTLLLQVRFSRPSPLRYYCVYGTPVGRIVELPA